MANDASMTSDSFARLTAYDQLAEPLRKGRLGDFQAKSDLASCLLPLLNALGWRDDLREIVEALPHFADALGLQEFRNVLARLGYKTERIDTALMEVDERLMPCLFIAEGGGANVLFGKDKDKDGIRIFDGYANMERTISPEGIYGTIYAITPEEITETEKAARKDNWMREMLHRFRRPIRQLAFSTMVLNFLALIVPIFVMLVYDRVVPTRSYETLAYLALGVIFVFGIDWTLRILRSRMISYIAARIEDIVATSTFQKIMNLPTQLTETAPLGNQVSRMREFDVIRDLFLGPLVTVVLELPFIVIFIGALAFLGGSLALVPIVMIVAYALIAFFILPALKRAVERSAKARAKRHGFLVEMVSGMRTIKEARAEERWLERYRDLSSEASYLQFQAAQISFFFQSLAGAVSTLAALATVGVGVFKILDGDMTVGALIASMAILWRILTPLQGFFLTLSRFEQIKISLRQINQLMRMEDEAEKDKMGGKSTRRHLTGAINFHRVSFRYKPGTEPALFALELRVAPGEMLAITGANGAGKSTLLRMALGLQQPQAGQVTIDGLDIRQIDPFELRQSIAYVPQTVQLFHGTIAQNMRLANPVASDEEIKEALHMAGALDDILRLPDELDTRIGDTVTSRLNAGLQQRLSLARAYLKRSSILLLDEPAQNLDEKGDKAFMETLKKLKGNTTIIMVSHRPSHIRLADKLAVLVRGQKVVEGKPEGILQQMLGAQS